MIGTIVSVTLAILLIPPENTTNDNTANIIPAIIGFIPNAVSNAAAIEFDCTAFPINPKASIINTANKLAKILPNLPLNAPSI